MSKTRAEIQFKAFSILTGSGTTPSAEEATALDGYIDAQIAEMNADGTIYIADPDDLADELFITFCKLVANSAADEFAQVSDEAKAKAFRDRLRVIVRQTPGYGPQEVTYF